MKKRAVADFLAGQHGIKVVLKSGFLIAVGTLGTVAVSNPAWAQQEPAPPAINPFNPILQFPGHNGGPGGSPRGGMGPMGGRPGSRGGRGPMGGMKGMPGMRGMGGMNQGRPDGADANATAQVRAVYSLSDGSKKTEKGRSITSQRSNVSAVYVSKGSQLQLNNPIIITSGEGSSNDVSKLSGLNAGLVAGASSRLVVQNGKIKTSGSNATGLFAVGQGANASMKGGSIETTGDVAHGVVATQGAALALNNVDVRSMGAWAAPVFTDQGSGTIDINGGSISSSGTNSAGLYSTSAITLKRAKVNATNSEGAIVDGKASIELTDTDLSGGRLGAMIYQSYASAAPSGPGTFTMRGGSLNAASGPLFYVSNTRATINLTDVKTTAVSGVLLNVGAAYWGQAGANGGQVTFLATQQELKGDMSSDALSSINLFLMRKSVLTGALNKVGLSLDASSQWNVTADSTLTTLMGAKIGRDNSISNIKGNGHTVTYDAALEVNKALGGKTYTLSEGGQLQPR